MSSLVVSAINLAIGMGVTTLFAGLYFRIGYRRAMSDTWKRSQQIFSSMPPIPPPTASADAIRTWLQLKQHMLEGLCETDAGRAVGFMSSRSFAMTCRCMTQEGMVIENPFVCPDCKMQSYNENDIKNKYCGNCHEYKKASL